MRFNGHNAVMGAIIYIYLFGYLLSASIGLATVAAIYTFGCMLLARWVLSDAESRTSKEIEFSRSEAMDAFGEEWSSFHHVFSSNEPVIERFRTALSSTLKLKCDCPELKEIVFKDVDRALDFTESRTFLHTSAKETPRKTGFVFLCSFTKSANVQGVRWWILIRGDRDPNKLFWYYLFSPVSLPFSIRNYLKRRWDPINGLTTIQDGFFNSIDILSRTRELQFVAFETLVEVLDSFSIDTSDLKQQKGNILNINVSGGQTSFGSVVQGAMNRVTGRVTGAGAQSLAGAQR